MGFYEFQCGFLATICASLKLEEDYISRQSGAGGTATASARDGAASALSRKYLIVYGLAMGA